MSEEAQEKKRRCIRRQQGRSVKAGICETCKWLMRSAINPKSKLFWMCLFHDGKTAPVDFSIKAWTGFFDIYFPFTGDPECPAWEEYKEK